MKIRISQQSGSALVVTLCTIGIIGIALAAHLDMTATQNRSVARSEAWNSSLVMAETGIEEAVQALYRNSTNGTALTGQGWVSNGTVFTLSRAFDSGRYSMIISNSSTPVIYSTGYRTTPLGTNEISRTVRATTQINALFAKGLLAKGTISLGNGNVSSFDSAIDGNFVRGVTGARSNGDTTSLTSSISIGPNGGINGHASVEPGGTITAGAQIGPVGTAGTQAGYTSFSASGTIPNVVLPSGVGSGLGTAIGGKTVFSGSIDSGVWNCAGSLPAITVSAGAHVVMFVGGSVSFSGNGGISIDATSSLTIYLAGSLSLSGNAFINNAGNALNFGIYGLPSCTSISVSGNGVLTAVIDAPQADLTFNGAGNRGGFAGAAIVNSATFNGNGTGFHYDENLGRTGPSNGFVVSGWDEL